MFLQTVNFVKISTHIQVDKGKNKSHSGRFRRIYAYSGIIKHIPTYSGIFKNYSGIFRQIKNPL